VLFAGAMLATVATAGAQGQAPCPPNAAEATCSVAVDSGTVRDLSPKAARSMKDALQGRAVFIDVRSWSEAESGVASGVDFVVPLRKVGLAGMLGALEDSNFVANVASAIRLVEGDLNTPVLLICRSGGRSSTAARRLADAGFRSVISVVGGMDGKPDAFDDDDMGWRAAGLPVEVGVDAHRLLRWNGGRL
jgi:rhodanese-related sulfurtransferase